MMDEVTKDLLGAQTTVDAQTVDRAWARFCGAFGDGPDAPYPGMIAAFETHYGQSFRDKEWRTEAACWAAAWSKATARAEAALAAPQPDAVAPARLVVIPSYDESKTAVEDGNATALHAFICDNEPADLELEKVFRETLQAVLNDAVGVFKP